MKTMKGKRDRIGRQAPQQNKLGLPLPSDSGVFVDAVTSSSTALRAGPDDLSLCFNTNAASVVAAAPESATTQCHPLHYHHHLHHFQDPIIGNDQINGHDAATALGVGVGTVFPLLTTSPCTWVPAAREEKQLMATAAATGGGGSSASTSAGKIPRLVISQTTNTHTSNTTSRSFDTNSSHQDAGSLPGQIQAPAVFKCVRVAAVEDGEDEYAYQAVVRIGGLVWRMH
ncbi:Protein LATERAL ROOT PRIMORDIUM 1 [Hibiscus syriacus]|uniref:Protein LATERAL ROOT PRIMORDIUM 1 n=1 Tax=Hibiscus syriacus TaxID=106335 RepID=A0A6A3CUZ8_HIBSY|nr:Protein LATERAL ROOT PRIMORDIUM 1 [Hibiscus syriacus]